MSTKYIKKFSLIFAFISLIFAFAFGQKQSPITIDIYVGTTLSPFEYPYSTTLESKGKTALNKLIDNINDISIDNPIGQDVGFDVNNVDNNLDSMLTRNFSSLYGVNINLDIKFIKFSAGIGSGKYNHFPLLAEYTINAYPLGFSNKIQHRIIGLSFREQIDLSTPIWKEKLIKQVGLVSEIKIFPKDFKDIFIQLGIYTEILDKQDYKHQSSIDLKLSFRL